LDGEFIKEVPIPGNPGSKMCIDQDGGILYSLADKSSGNFILEYKITD